jgi:hypothetical protein
MAQQTREMPARADGWRPTDEVFEGIIKRCVEDAEAGASRDGTREYMAGFLILGVLGVLVLVTGQPVLLALLLPAGLFAAVAFYVVNNSEPGPVARHRALNPIGGPGGLPAGYLVHPRAWQAGMAEHVAFIPESQLRAAAELARTFPGSVDDLLIFTGTIAAQLPAPKQQQNGSQDVQRRAADLVRVGVPILQGYLEKYPAPKPAPAGKKGKKK